MKTKLKSIKNGWKHISLYFVHVYVQHAMVTTEKQHNHNQHHQSKSYQRNAKPKIYCVFNLTNAITDCSLSNGKRERSLRRAYAHAQIVSRLCSRIRFNTKFGGGAVVILLQLVPL